MLGAWAPARHVFSNCVYVVASRVQGETPHTISLYAFDELVDAVMPGDRVLITGVFRATTYRQNPRLTSISSVFRTHVDVIHFKKAESNRLHSEDPTAVDEESKQLFKEGDVTEAALAARRTRVVAMSRDDNLYEHLSISLAPSIWELPDIKKGLLLQLFGGSNKDLGKQGRFRGEINVLLCGDPGASMADALWCDCAVS